MTPRTLTALPGLILTVALTVACGAEAPQGPGSGQPASAGDDDRRVRGEYLVRLAPGAEPDVIDRAFHELGVELRRPLTDDTYLVRLKRDPGPVAVADRAAGVDGIRSVQPNYRYRPQQSLGRGPVLVLGRGTHCGRSEPKPAAQWLPSRQALDQALRRTGLRPSEVPDFGRSVALLVEMGQRPTAGYALDLGDPRLPVSGDAATLRLHWRRPGPGAVTAQVITSPCLLLAVPRPGYGTLEVVDGDGRRRLRVAVPRDAQKP